MQDRPKINVRIGYNLTEFIVSGTDLERVLIFNNEVKYFNGRKNIKFKCHNISKNGQKSLIPHLVARVESPTGLVSFEGKKYRGKILILSSVNKNKCDVINEVEVETYINSLLAKEMNGSWPVEALKAQAVAARTYAYHKIKTKQVSKIMGHNTFYDIENSEKHQVTGSFFDITKNTFKAGSETRGEILVSKSNKLNSIFFHARCGGKTLRPDQVWQNKVEGYKSVKCPFCLNSEKGRWKRSISIKKVKKFLLWVIKRKNKNLEIDKIINQKLLVAPDKSSNSKLRIYLGEKVLVIEKSLLRKFFGRKYIPSNNFYAIFGENIQLIGNGLGHGVGMCQVGALHMSKKGWNYRKILKFYFPNYNIKKVY